MTSTNHPMDSQPAAKALQYEIGLMGSVVMRAQIRPHIERLPRPFVFTNGVFDFLHKGHITYLAAARALGASLILGLNTDASVRRLGKGAERPINTEMDRALVLAGLRSVDCVTFFSEETPCELIEQLRPDIYAKGGDYDMSVLEEARLVRSWGGEAHALPFLDGYSTSAILNRLAKGEN